VWLPEARVSRYYRSRGIVCQRYLTSSPASKAGRKKRRGHGVSFAKGPTAGSTDRHAASRFRAVTLAGYRADDGRRRRTTCHVQRDGDRVYVLILTENTLPYCYITNGLLAVFDQTRRGRLLVYEGGGPVIQLGGGGAGGPGHIVDYQLSYDSRAPAPYLSLDSGSLTRAISDAATNVGFDRTARIISAKTAQGEATLALAADGDESSFPLRSLCVVGRHVESFAVGSIAVGPEVSPSATC
jgi:hypothetical protein